MNCCAGRSVSISSDAGERLKAEAKEALAALSNSNNQVTLKTLGHAREENLTQVTEVEFERLMKKSGELNVSFPRKYWAPWHFFRE